MTKLYALLADIHGNLEALESVLRDIDTANPDEIIILGDTIGYGPNPKECLKKASEIADLFLIGNHEAEAIKPEDDLNEEAKEALQWAEKQLTDLSEWQRIRDNIALQGCEKLALKGHDDRIFVHASPKNPIKQYIWPGHECQYIIYNGQIDQRLSEFMDEFARQHGFCAHTHVPAVLTEYQNQKIFDPYRCDIEWNRRDTFIGPNTLFFVPVGNVTLHGIEGKKVVINPGSIGQPRDGNPAASYALYDGNTVRFKRISYDFEKTGRKILDLPIKEETKRVLSERLAKGI